jgi:hypothetical protein
MRRKEILKTMKRKKISQIMGRRETGTVKKKTMRNV